MKCRSMAGCKAQLGVLLASGWKKQNVSFSFIRKLQTLPSNLYYYFHNLYLVVPRNLVLDKIQLYYRYSYIHTVIVAYVYPFFPIPQVALRDASMRSVFLCVSDTCICSRALQQQYQHQQWQQQHLKQHAAVSQYEFNSISITRGIRESNDVSKYEVRTGCSIDKLHFFLLSYFNTSKYMIINLDESLRAEAVLNPTREKSERRVPVQL